MATETIVNDGTWSVHQRPRSVRSGDYTFVGYAKSNGDIGISAYDHTDGSVEDTTLYTTLTRIDDHSSPAIYIRDDERLVVLWQDRGSDDDTFFWTISDNALDISSWGDVNSSTESASVDYGAPVQWDGDLRHFVRFGGSGPTWKYFVSTDGGQTFGSPQDFVSFSGEDWIYIHPFKDTTGENDRLHFAVGDHRMSDPSVRHWFLENGDYYKSDGTLIQSAGQELTDLDSLTTVYNGSGSGNNPPKLYDLIVDSNGHPHVAFTEHVSTGTGGGDGDYRARWAAWNGSGWDVGSEITAMGGALPESHYYEGGLSLDSQDPTTVYVSVEQNGRNYQIQEWTTTDGGSSWSKEQDLSPADATITDPTKRGRPISPRGHNGDLPVLWWAGKYDDYSGGGSYDTEVNTIEVTSVSSVTVTTGYTLTVEADIINTGSDDGEQTVTLSKDGTQVDSQSVTVSEGSTEPITLEWLTESGDEGDYTMTVESENDSDSVSVTVET